MRYLVVLLLLSTAIAADPLFVAKEKDLMHRIEECYFEAFNSRDYELMETLYAPRAVFYFEESRLIGSKRILEMAQEWVAALPDLYIRPLYAMQSEDIITFHWCATGTHLLPLNGKKGTGKEVVFHGLTNFRILDNQVVEHWASIDYKPLER